MHKYNNSKLPTAFDGQLVKTFKYSLLFNQEYLKSHKFRFARLQKSFRYTQAQIWNNIENKIKLQTINKFDKKYKNYLIQEY